jgi:hypothetical protein
VDDLRCWLCGVEPERLIDVTTLGSPEPQYLPQWPRGDDHQHAATAPTPGELEQAGHDALMRIYSAARRS